MRKLCCFKFNKGTCFGEKFYRFAVEDHKKGCFSCSRTFFFTPRKVAHWTKNRGKERSG